MSAKIEMMTFTRDGAEQISSALNDDELNKIKTAVAHLPSDRAGIRLKGISALNAYVSIDGKIGKLAQAILGAKAMPVRAVLFDKTPIMNWKLNGIKTEPLSFRNALRPMAIALGQ